MLNSDDPPFFPSKAPVRLKTLRYSSEFLIKFIHFIYMGMPGIGLEDTGMENKTKQNRTEFSFLNSPGATPF